MPSPSQKILDNIAGVLRELASLQHVAVGEFTDCPAMPRAAVQLEGVESLIADDSANARWLRVKCRIVIQTRSDGNSAALARAQELCQSAADKLLQDPHRAGLACDIPPGRATEIGELRLSKDVRRPVCELSLSVRCHLELREGN